ncbi:hypothetical protein BOW51_06995 [Solemya velesiana gill symbiont]|uniref:Uncharacterized protein n=1 Tax=Solemya velesiana gill symbiont TaxID=1918948 RepID=A0A1T2KUV0_9GAMM|nr:hypothetical protein BOW51_06995 [Solemya velesiana gill symbiont]
MRPGNGLFTGSQQGFRLANRDTVTAEVTAAPGKVHLRVATLPFDDQAVETGGKAFVTPGAFVDEQLFGQCRAMMISGV